MEPVVKTEEKSLDPGSAPHQGLTDLPPEGQFCQIQVVEDQNNNHTLAEQAKQALFSVLSIQEKPEDLGSGQFDVESSFVNPNIKDEDQELLEKLLAGKRPWNNRRNSTMTMRPGICGTRVKEFEGHLCLKQTPSVEENQPNSQPEPQTPQQIRRQINPGFAFKDLLQENENTDQDSWSSWSSESLPHTEMNPTDEKESAFQEQAPVLEVENLDSKDGCIHFHIEAPGLQMQITIPHQGLAKSKAKKLVLREFENIWEYNELINPGERESPRKKVDSIYAAIRERAIKIRKGVAAKKAKVMARVNEMKKGLSDWVQEHRKRGPSVERKEPISKSSSTVCVDSPSSEGEK